MVAPFFVGRDNDRLFCPFDRPPELKNHRCAKRTIIPHCEKSGSRTCDARAVKTRGRELVRVAFQARTTAVPRLFRLTFAALGFLLLARHSPLAVSARAACVGYGCFWRRLLSSFCVIATRMSAQAIHCLLLRRSAAKDDKRFLHQV